MFGSKKKQYVTVLKQDKQLKINYKILQDDKTLKEEHSSFLMTNQSMPGDALFKLDALQKDIPHTYVAALFEGKNQKVVPTEEVDVISYESVKLNESQSIVVPKNELTSATRYFINSGIDYIFSPFTLLNEYLQDMGVKNSLNVFVLNNTVYAILLGDLKQVIKAETKELTPYEEIIDEEFSDDEIVDQKLYEEVYFLELQQFLNDIVQEYYSSSEDVDFLEQIKLLYTLQPFTKEQIDSLYETLMVNVSYEQIDLQYYMANTLVSEDILRLSFIEPRIKKESSSSMGWLFLFVLSLIAISLVVYFNMSEPIPEEKTQPQEKTMAEKKPVEVKKSLEQIEVKNILPKFPNHKTSNNNIKQRVAMLFDIVPYDAVLKDIEISDMDTTYVVNFAMPNGSLEDMQTKLKNIFKESNVLLKHQNKAVLNTIIENNSIITSEEEITVVEYPKLNFLSISQAIEYIQKLLDENATVKLETKEKDQFEKYIFNIVSPIQNPDQFFILLDKLNKQHRALNMAYPIKFSKTNEGIEIKFNLELYQEKEKPVELKK